MSIRPDLWGAVLRPTVTDFWMQLRAADRPVQRRLSGPEARETLSGQREYLPRKSKEEMNESFDLVKGKTSKMQRYFIFCL